MNTDTIQRVCAAAIAFYRGDDYDVNSSIGFSLKLLTVHMRSEIEARMARSGITAAQWHPLFLLKLGKVTTAVELAREVGIDAGATTRMVDRLVAKGFVERVRSDSDRRVVYLRLTKAGHEASDLIPHVLSSVQNDFLSGFSEDELGQLKGLVGRMIKNGEALRAARPSEANASSGDAESATPTPSSMP